MLKHVFAIILNIKNCTSIIKVVQAINYNRILENHAFKNINFKYTKDAHNSVLHLSSRTSITWDKENQCLFRKI